MRNHNTKLNISSKEELVENAKGHNVHKIDWKGPGWYYIFKYNQKCPRGCCYDDVFEAISAKSYSEMISHEIRELSYKLKESRKLSKVALKN